MLVAVGERDSLEEDAFIRLTGQDHASILAAAHQEIIGIEAQSALGLACVTEVEPERPKQQDSVEVHINGEFVGVLFKDEEDGEISYAFNMAILEMDLPEPPASRAS